jgi:hypothetical protein
VSQMVEHPIFGWLPVDANGLAMAGAPPVAPPRRQPPRATAPTRQPPRRPEPRQQGRTVSREVALHESGHACVAVSLCVPITRLRLEPSRDGPSGFCEAQPSDSYSELLMLLGGPMVNDLWGFDWDGWGDDIPNGDRARAHECLSHWAPAEREGVLSNASQRVERLVREKQDVIEALATELLERRELSGSEVRAFVGV